jgi:hypothetical protein
MNGAAASLGQDRLMDLDQLSRYPMGIHLTDGSPVVQLSGTQGLEIKTGTPNEREEI